MRGPGAWLAVAALVAPAACEIVTREPLPQGDVSGQVPPSSVPPSGGSVTGESPPGPPADCSLPSFTLIDADRVIPWSCILAFCPGPAMACASDCGCNTVFTQALQCLLMGGATPSCFVPALQDTQDPAVMAFTQCLLAEQAMCVESDAGAIDATVDAGAIDAGAIDAMVDAGAIDATDAAPTDVADSD